MGSRMFRSCNCRTIIISIAVSIFIHQFHIRTVTIFIHGEVSILINVWWDGAFIIIIVRFCDTFKLFGSSRRWHLCESKPKFEPKPEFESKPKFEPKPKFKFELC